MASRSSKPLLARTKVPQPQLQVVVPSAWRAGAVLTDQFLDPADFVVLVAEDQVDAYRLAQPHLRYDVYPGGEDDGKWEWALDKYGSVLWLDDDMHGFMVCEWAEGRKEAMLHGDEVMAVFARSAWEARQLGAYLFGYANGSPLDFDPAAPLRLTGFFTSGCYGQLEGHGLWWHEDIVGGGDYWLAALNAHLHRVVWIDKRYKPVEKQGATFRTPGGAGRVRNMQTEEADFRLLKRYFGDAIVRKQPTARASLTHDYQRRLDVPF